MIYFESADDMPWRAKLPGEENVVVMTTSWATWRTNRADIRRTATLRFDPADGHMAKLVPGDYLRGEHPGWDFDRALLLGGGEDAVRVKWDAGVAGDPFGVLFELHGGGAQPERPVLREPARLYLPRWFVAVFVGRTVRAVPWGTERPVFDVEGDLWSGLLRGFLNRGDG